MHAATDIEAEIAEILRGLSEDELRQLEKELEKVPPGEALAIPPAARRVTTRSTRRRTYDLSQVKKAAGQIAALPGEHETIHCLMGGDFHAADVIPAVWRLAGAPIDELLIATLGFNKTNTAALCGLFDDGQVGSISLACSQYFRSTDPATYNFAEQELRARGQHIVATRTHAKLLLFRFGNARYVVESSANLRSCNCLEQFSLCRSDELFEFHRNWLEMLYHGR